MRAVAPKPKTARRGLTRPTIAPVPEPTTMIVGALLLLFGASTIRFLRQNRTA